MAEMEYLTIKAALELAKKKKLPMSHTTLIARCKKYNFGKQLVGKHGMWYIYAGRFRRWLETGD